MSRARVFSALAWVWVLVMLVLYLGAQWATLHPILNALFSRLM